MNEGRRNIVMGAIVLVGLVFVCRLFYLQVVDSKYKLAAQDNTIRRKTIYPYRGLIYDRNNKLIVYNAPVYDLMVEKKKVRVRDTVGLCKMLGIEVEYYRKTMKAIKGIAANRPEVLVKQISEKDFARLQDRFHFSGFTFVPRIVRSYPNPIMANTLGYLAEISPKELESDSESYYKQGDYIGKGGIEKSYEKYLRGKRGAKFIMVNVHGVEKGAFNDGKFDTLAVAGENLTTSIDLDIQLLADSLMKNKVGSVVAIEPSSGEILAIVSSPSYDPNLLVGREYSKNYSVLNRDKLKPLFDRATQASYPPGSIFKLVQALIGQQMGVIDASTSYPCNKGIVGCHNHPSPLDLHGSIQHSCNPYYYGVFRKILNQGLSTNTFIDTEMGFDRWYTMVTAFGFGKKMGSDIRHEKGGKVPSNKFYDKWYGDKRWKVSTIHSNAIGQGELLVVPLQMANLAAIIANRGYFYTPHMVKKIGNSTKHLKEFRTRHNTGIHPKYFDPVVDAMEDVVLAGTARKARIDSITVCGKTGTAQNPHGEDHAVFVAFAPKVNPKIAISVYVENAGFGGTWAAPIASLIIEKYLTGQVKRQKMSTQMQESDLIHKHGEQRQVP